jgi:hypothetical protein
VVTVELGEFFICAIDCLGLFFSVRMQRGIMLAVGMPRSYFFAVRSS